MQVEFAREELARQTRRGIGNVVAYLLVWIALGALGLLVQDRSQRALIYLIAAILMWPLSLATSRLLRGAQGLRENPLFGLALLAGASHILTIPLIVGAYLTTPAMMPLYLGVLLGAQLLINTWIYGSLAYLFASLGVVEVATLSGWLAPSAVHVTTPFLVAGVMVITMFFLLGELSSNKGPDRN